MDIDLFGDSSNPKSCKMCKYKGILSKIFYNHFKSNKHFMNFKNKYHKNHGEHIILPPLFDDSKNCKLCVMYLNYLMREL